MADVELDRPYAVVLTTPAGLWSYVLGDTVRFTARDPLRLVITGRTRHFVNAFGENVIVEEVEQALLGRVPGDQRRGRRVHGGAALSRGGEARGGHDWLVEFRDPARSTARLSSRALDAAAPARSTPTTARSGRAISA